MASTSHCIGPAALRCSAVLAFQRRPQRSERNLWSSDLNPLLLVAPWRSVDAGSWPAPAASAWAAQPEDPWTYIRQMETTPDFGQAPGQPASDFDRIEVDGRRWDAFLRTPVKEGQDFHYTCEFDSAWI